MVNNIEEHYRYIRNILIWILLLNWGVAIAKILYGLLSRCASMTADGFHSLSDGASNIICLAGIHFASKPTDRDHPYGHKKYETFFSLGIAALLAFLCFNLFREGIMRIYNPVTPIIGFNSFMIMLITLAVNVGVMRYEYKKGSALKSDALVSDSLHTKADILTSVSVIVTLAIMKLNPAYRILDSIVTMIIALFIAHAAFEIIKAASAILCDTVAKVEVKKIADIVLAIPGVVTCHKIRTRGRSDDIHIDLHVQVAPNMHIDTAHKISYDIEEALKENIPEVTDVVVHMEPKEKFRRPAG